MSKDRGVSLGLIPLLTQCFIYFKMMVESGVRILDKDVVGKVVHYYDKIGVAIVKLEKNLKTGDKVKFVHGDNAFEQTVESMQLEHAQVDNGKAGDEVAIKVNQVAKDGTLVYFV